MTPFNDGTFRWCVYFEGETRHVYAKTQARAIKVAEQAQRLTNAPKKARKALSAVLVGGSDEYIGKPFLIGTPLLTQQAVKGGTEQ